MKTADLYIRVSTDEQADKGYSQRNQEEVLVKYCQSHEITVRKIVFEDHSAKTFNRPEWTKLLDYLRQHKNKSELILFTKWDRFSRNAPDAYQMIAKLKTFGVEPQAIEQPLDMAVPENKMMLAIYLTAPEIENDRRALNVFYGMRRAKKEGRWVATAPVGYVNRTLEDGKKQIVFKEPQASLLKWAFKEISLGRYSTEQIWKATLAKGLTCSKHNFWVAIKNPIYCGKIVIPKLKDEESYTVQGLHEALISEGLFYEVQDALNGRRKQQKAKIVALDELALRGFIHCSNCTRILTGSASKGRKQYYHYYHCSSDCGYREKAEIVNQEFIDYLKGFTLNSKAAVLFRAVIIDTYNDLISNGNINRKQAVEQVTLLNNKITKARELLLDGDIDGKDYRDIKTEAEQKIAILEDRLSSFKSGFIKIGEVERILDEAIVILCKLDEIYSNSDGEKKRNIIGSIFPGKFTFENIKHRTAKVSESFKVIWLINKELEGKKNDTKENNSSLCHRVIPLGLEPRTPTLKVLCSTS